jgi:hypothetical protein
MGLSSTMVLTLGSMKGPPHLSFRTQALMLPELTAKGFVQMWKLPLTNRTCLMQRMVT